MAHDGGPDRAIPFVDAHHHLWQLGRLPYGWLDERNADEEAVLGDYTLVRTSWAPDRFFREFHGQNVIKSVHIEADMDGPDPVAETEWLAEVVREHGRPNGLVVHADLRDQDVERTLDRHLQASDLVRGVRIRKHPSDVDDRAFRRGIRALVSRGLSYELNAAPGNLASGRRLASEEPDLTVILGHAGLPLERADDYLHAWADELATLAQADNVVCKVSGFGMTDHGWTVDSIRSLVLRCIDSFGVDRIMFGTNWPVDLLYAPYTEQVDAYRQILADAGFGRSEQGAMLHGNAERLYRI